MIALTENRYEGDVNFRHENLNVFFLSMQEKINQVSYFLKYIQLIKILK